MNTQDLSHLLASHPYPGRGIVLGCSPDGAYAMLAYFIMGRSENSRNRIFVPTGDGIRTQAFDAGKMSDPSLIIYHPVRVFQGASIVTNGDQTDTVLAHLQQGMDFRQALNTREYEPDDPNFTPRISGLLAPDGRYCLSILKRLDGDPPCCARYFFEYDTPLPGTGHFIHTYQANEEPLPSFQGEPRQVALDTSDINHWSHSLWSSLNAENRVSLFVRRIHLATGSTDSVIINQNQ